MTSPVYAIEAPADRIWAYTNARGSRVWTAMMPAIAGAHEEQEYVRADLHEEAARKAEALQREMAEKDAEASWHPITTCPFREPVDLWCVYGGEEFAQYDGGASIGKLVPNRHKTEEYGFFGNQSNDGVPQGHARDLIPVAWRKAVPQCPSDLIAEVLGIPRTIEDARALIGGDDA